MIQVDLNPSESVRQLAGAWGTFVTDYGERHGRVDVAEMPSIDIRWADSKFRFWNCVALHEGISRAIVLEERLAWAAEFMRDRREPGLLWVFEDLLPPDLRASLADLAEQFGLAFAFTFHGMAGDILPIEEPAHPQLEFVRVRNQDQLTAFADINSRAYGFPLGDGRDGLCGSRLWTSDMHSYLGMENGQPVSAAATVAIDGCLYLALVATLPEKQRLGYGEATVRKALFEGGRATGLKRASLHATQAGLPGYEHIGYQKVAAIRAFVLKD